MDKADCRIDIAHMIPVALGNHVIEPAPFIAVPAPRVLIYPENPFLLDLLEKCIILENHSPAFPARNIFDWIKTEAGDVSERANFFPLYEDPNAWAASSTTVMLRSFTKA